MIFWFIFFLFQPASCDITVVTIIADCLPSPVRYMGYQCCRLFKRTELL
jgi:hypothetical protein